MLNWKQNAEALWGPDFAIPMAAVFGIALRTVQRWRATDYAPRRVQQQLEHLVRLVAPDVAPAYGHVLMQLALGGTTGGVAEAQWRFWEAVDRCGRHVARGTLPGPQQLQQRLVTKGDADAIDG